MFVRIFLTFVVLLAVWSAGTAYTRMIQPRTQTDLALSQIQENGSRETMLIQQHNNGNVFLLIDVIGILCIVGIWIGKIKQVWKQTALVVLFASLMLSSGCRQPYETEENVEVKNNETAFVVPLEDKVEKGKQFQSVEALKNLQVSTKRIRISHRWKSNDYETYGWDGQWIPTIAVIKVDRTPLTRSWTADKATGSNAKDDAIWVESKDSIGFSTGFTCTAYIQETAAAKFLYWYPSGSLANVMDQEIRGKIQSVVAEVSAEYDMDELREKKNEIIAKVRTDVEPYFEARGITIQNIGMFGGFTYENKAIQDAIDKVFVAQQLKNVAKAELEAQADINRRIMSAAQADANAVVFRSKGEAEGIQIVAKASEEANKSPAFLQLKQLEINAKWINKWSGVLPLHYWTTGGSPKDMSIIVNSPGLSGK